MSAAEPGGGYQGSGAWRRVPGQRSLEAGTRAAEPGGGYQGSGAWRRVPGQRSLEAGAGAAEPGGGHQGSGAWRRVPGQRSLEAGAGAAEPGGGCRGSGAWRRAPGQRSLEAGAGAAEPGGGHQGSGARPTARVPGGSGDREEARGSTRHSCERGTANSCVTRHLSSSPQKRDISNLELSWHLRSLQWDRKRNGCIGFCWQGSGKALGVFSLGEVWKLMSERQTQIRIGN